MPQEARHKHTHHHHFLGHCPTCGLGYDDRSVEVLRKGENVTVVHAECERCGSAAVLMMLAGMLGIITTVGMLTDMAREDIERLWNAGEITLDDVLEMHAVLEQTAR